MGVFVIFFILFFLIIGLFCLIVFGTSHLILKKSKQLDRYYKMDNKLNGKLQKVLVFVFVVLITIGVSQIAIYYLFSGPFFWYILLSFGLVFILLLLPYALVFLPFYKRKKTIDEPVFVLQIVM